MTHRKNAHVRTHTTAIGAIKHAELAIPTCEFRTCLCVVTMNRQIGLAKRSAELCPGA
jgi:hypothetical protein